MRVSFISCLLAVGLLSGCSKNEPQPLPSPPSPPPVSSSPTPAPAPPASRLTITNQPVTAPPLAANGKTEQGFQVRNGGNLFLTFPRAWKNKIARIPEGPLLIDSILFRPRNGEEFDMMLGVNNVGEAKADNTDLKAMLNQAGQAELTNSVEKTLTIQDLSGPQVTGYYFVVTDKTVSADHPEKGQYPYLAQGYAKIGGLIVSFRLVSVHIAPEQAEMLDMIKTARFEKK